MKKNTPLSAEIENGELVIRIGIDTLAYAAERCPKFYEYDKHEQLGVEIYCKICDPAELAKDVKRELFREKEDGSSPFSDLLDECIVAARDDGSLAFADDDAPNEETDTQKGGE